MLAGQLRVEAVARQVFGPKVLVALTQNRSTMISYSLRQGVLHLRLHRVFASASEEVLRAVAAFVSGKTTARQSALIDAWIEKHRHLIRTSELIKPQPYGEYHNLQALRDDLNRRYFQGTMTARITWSKALRGRKRHSIRMGSYCEEQNLIRIHPALDQAFVPAYFVQSVVFHEMLHELHGAEEERDGRRAVHTPEFLEDEQRYENFGRAKRWEQKNLHRLLRY